MLYFTFYMKRGNLGMRKHKANDGIITILSKKSKKISEIEIYLYYVTCYIFWMKKVS